MVMILTAEPHLLGFRVRVAELFEYDANLLADKP